MKSIILSAGLGKRLRPLTNKTPKVMLKIGSKPLLEHQLYLLKKYGFSDISINLHHLPDIITNYFGNGERWKVKITYSYEPELLGTAGAVKKLESFFTSTNLLVHYGDNLTNINLARLNNYYKKKKAICVIALYESDEPWTMGIVDVDKNNRVIKFIEKPNRNCITTKWVNAGTIILNRSLLKYIPKNKYFDFGKDFFPLLIKNNIPIYGFKTTAYIQDIGNIQRYRKACKDFKDGLIKII